AEYHINSDNLAIEVVTPGQIFNEFSSGAPDVAAIRDFVKMIYDRGTPENLIKYLLLFGDGSFDNISEHENNTNYILTYQSENSIRPTQSYVTDDFFGLLDDTEGGSDGLIDIGIGRLPVTTVEEAQEIVDKITRYGNPEAMGDWRNNICFIGDDEDNNIHMRDANTLATFIDTVYPSFNVQKIFLDAYPQVSSPRGESYPEVNTAINNRINSGALIINYTGHGNERGLAHEQILSMDDIPSWKNKNRLPLFITATCEFSRFDDIDREINGEIKRKTSAGEKVILNTLGGGIGLLTTTRLVYSSPNFILNQNFYKYAFKRDSQMKPYKLGDILRLTKNVSGSGINKRNFTLLGDPALALSYPLYNIITDSINGHDIETADTLEALSRVTISGHIENLTGEIMDTFSGIVYPMVFDKPSTVTTLGNDETPVMQFMVQDNVLYKGKASVSNGNFSFSFVVPKDISYNIDYGKISYYATNSVFDANGVYKEILIGGFSTDYLSDEEGPEIELYMNNRNFVSGGITDENPKILAFISDPNGINTVGNGIGHDITAVLDDDYRNLIVLNNYYESDLNSYQSGKVEYPLSGLSEGNHIIVLKIWDILNNSAEASIEFVVTRSSGFIIEELFNYPNPFTDNTSFVFEHNQAESELNILLQVFTLSGKIIKTIETQIYSDGFRSDPIIWDGLDDHGNKIGTGIYIYRLQVRSSNDQMVVKTQKLVILR
ncbi:MAG: type IX secretion system sortase PorU, partial [Bacteroidetes bacterium]|nr:type IX secretion system sortase PorU [Bacteroidota bacterium]